MRNSEIVAGLGRRLLADSLLPIMFAGALLQPAGMGAIVAGRAEGLR